MTLTITDIKKIQTVVLTVVQGEVDPLKKDVQQLKKSMNSLTSSVDGAVKILERHDQELIVLGAQQKKVHGVLVKKSIATEEEFAVA